MDGLIIEEVQNMALGGEVREFRRQQNRAMLASWGELKVKSEQDKLRTMTWADLGLRYNIEPFRKESVQRYVTLPGAAADQYINEASLGFDTLLEHLDVWNAVNPTPFPSFYHNRNFKGGDALRYCYGDIQRMGAKAGPDGVVRLRQPTPTTITFMADEREAPTEDEGERPPKMKPIRSLAEEEMDEESDEEPLMTNRKRKGVNQPESRQEPFLLAIGGQAGPGGEEGGTGYVELPDYFDKYGGPPKEKLRAASSPSPKENLPEPDIPLSERVQQPRACRPVRATLPSAGLGGLDTSQLNPDKLKKGVFGKSQGETPAEQKGGLGERPQGPKLARRQSWSDMVEADEAETARARAEWEAKKKTITGGSLNLINEQPVELPSQLAQENLTVVCEGKVGREPAQNTVQRDDRGTVDERNERAQTEGGTMDSQATTDEETVKAQFKISPVKAGGVEAGAQVEEGPGREKEVGEDAALKKQGGAEGEQLEEEEGEPMEGLEEERPARMEGVKGEKPAESQRVEERKRGEKERVKKEKKDKKKKDKKKKKGQKKEGEKSRSEKSPLGEGTVKKGGPDVAMKMALEIPDPLIQAGVARTLRLNRGKTDSKDSDSTSGDEKEGEGDERGRAKEERAQEEEKCYGHVFGGGTRTRQTARMTAGSARLKQPPTEVPPAEPSGESTPESEGGVEGVQEESSEDRKIEGLKATKAQLDEELRLKQIRIGEKERKLRLERE
jgi:hypothetical protein